MTVVDWASRMTLRYLSKLYWNPILYYARWTFNLLFILVLVSFFPSIYISFLLHTCFSYRIKAHLFSNSPCRFPSELVEVNKRQFCTVLWETLFLMIYMRRMEAMWLVAAHNYSSVLLKKPGFIMNRIQVFVKSNRHPNVHHAKCKFNDSFPKFTFLFSFTHTLAYKDTCVCFINDWMPIS